MKSADELVEEGRELHHAGDRPVAAVCYEQAAQLREEAGEVHPAMHALRHAADLRLELGEIEAARSAMRRVLDAYRGTTVDGSLEMANALRIAALAEEAAGSFGDAQAMWREARGIYEDLGIEPGVKEADQRLAAMDRLLSNG